MSKARTLADIVAAGSPLVDGTIETTDITNVTASATELNYVDGVTSNVQTQLDTKAPTASPTFTGTAVIPTASVTTLNLGGTAITATATELNYVDGVTSAVQTQIDTKAPTASPTFTGTVDLDKLTVNTAAGTSGQVLTSGGSGAAPTWADAASGGEADFVATGAISNGDLVGLNADGTVSVIQSFIGSETVFESAVTYFTSSVFDSNSNKVVIVYADNGNSLYGTAVVGTVSGTSISFGTPVVFESDYAADISTTFDSNSNKVVIAYRDTANSNYGTAIVGTVSGTSISFGTPVVFESSNLTNISATFDSNSNKVVIAYRDYGNSEYGTAIVGTVSGTSISFGTAVVFDSTVTVNISAVFDSNSNKVVIAYEDASNSEYGTAVVGTVSGTSISFGTPVVFDSVRTDYISATFDSNSNKVVIAYAGTSTFYGTAVVGTVSGTSISFGTPVTFNSNGATRFIAISFDSNSNKVVIAYRDDGNSDQATVIAGAVSGTSISFDTPYVFDTRSAYTSSAFDSNSNKVVISYMDDFNSDYGTSIVFDANSFSVFNGWVGIAAEDISDTATGSVNIVGGVNEGQTGLTVGSKYYLQNDATISTTLVTGREVGRAIAADKIFITQGSIS